MQRAAHAYLQTQVTTNSPGEILILLYDGAINFLNRAKEYLSANDMAGKGIYISKALDIINELDSCLNLEKGGELANNLHSLYFFCSSRLVMANLKKDVAMIDEVIKILNGVRGAYTAIASQPEAQAAAQQSAASRSASSYASARPQAGLAPSGGSSSMPGASARIRSMHAMHQQEREELAEAAQSAQAALPAPGASGQAPLAEPMQDMSPIPSSVSNGFAKRSGSELYRKFAGQSV